jgi:hypothetical protein
MGRSDTECIQELVADEQKHVSVLENVFIQKVLLYGSGQL